MLKKLLIVVLGVLILSTCNNKNLKKDLVTNDIIETKLPNIVIIYADDLGYGDISANGATEINTPNIDYLANNGMRFTNGYSSSATCTPSRYALLTGVYPWKNKRAKILGGNAPLIIDTALLLCQNG